MRKIIIIFIVFILNANYAFAGMIVGDTANGCNNSINLLYAVFEPNQYTCAPGYYLPANHDGCEPCLSGATCAGGTFTFNKYFAKGIVYTNSVATDAGYGCQAFDARMTAVFEPNQHTCDPGQYLPAGVDACTTCPIGSYCGGGTYTFNPTTTQGITTCPNGWTSPAGSSSVGQCGYVLHIGQEFIHLRSERLTNTSLNFRIGDDIFYGNMTTTPTVYHAGTNHELKIQIGNTIYYVYDDTVTP